MIALLVAMLVVLVAPAAPPHHPTPDDGADMLEFRLR